MFKYSPTQHVYSIYDHCMSGQ